MLTRLTNSNGGGEEMLTRCSRGGGRLLPRSNAGGLDTDVRCCRGGGEFKSFRLPDDGSGGGVDEFWNIEARCWTAVVGPVDRGVEARGRVGGVASLGKGGGAGFPEKELELDGSDMTLEGSNNNESID